MKPASDRLARLFVIAVFVGLGLSLAVGLGYNPARAVEIHARMPEAGGWMPGDLHVQAGQALELRLVSDDVVHGFAIGQSDLPEVELKPGQVRQLTLSFDQPGTYTYYCTRWCGPNHWRMRGTIEVTAEGDQSFAPADGQPPLYARLGIDIDAPLHAQILPQQRPSAARGAEIAAGLPQDWDSAYRQPDELRRLSPEQLWKVLRLEPALHGQSDQQLWDLVAVLYRSQLLVQEQPSSQALAEAGEVYARNCAACHGERGAGDGVFAGRVAADPAMQAMLGHASGQPADFSDAHTLLAASPARLQGKILRGGMGSGMPNWGSILTEDQTWALVAYLWTFQFDLEVQP